MNPDNKEAFGRKLTCGSYDDDWDELQPEAFGEKGSEVSGNSLNNILHSILGGSSNRSDIGSIRDESSFGSYGDDFALESTDSQQKGEEKPLLAGEQDKANLADHGRGTGIVEDDDVEDEVPRVKTVGATADKEQALASHVPDSRCGGGSRQKNLRRSGESIHRGDEGGHVGVGNNENISGNNTNQAEKNKISNNAASSSRRNNTHDDHDDEDDRHGHYHRSNDTNKESNDGDHGNGSDSKNDLPVPKNQHSNRNEGKPTRWPTRQSVESSAGYVFYARIAGDYPDRTILGTATPRRHQRRPRRRRRKHHGHTDAGKGRQEYRSQSPHEHEFDDQVWNEPNDRKNCCQDEGRPLNHNRRSPGRNAPTTGDLNRGGATGGGGGVECSNGLSILEKDMRGAMVAVWLAWGVRIDAAREELLQEERWLEAVHRTEIAQVRSNLTREYERSTHHGITPEVLECVVQDATLRELGELERANCVRMKAMRARKSQLARRKENEKLRRPMLESALRKKQAAEILVVRRMAETFEAKLARARDDTVRLLQLHLSRAKRLVLDGAVNTSSRNRKQRTDLRHGGSLVLRQSHLLKLGEVLLLAQETANRSIERALRRRRDETDGVKVAGITVQDVVDSATCGSGENRNIRTCGSASKIHRTCGSASTIRRSVGLRRGTTSGDNDDITNAISTSKTKAPRSRGLWRDESGTSALRSQAGCCLWCKPPPVGRQRRHSADEAAYFLLPGGGDRIRVHHAVLHTRHTTTRTGRAQQPKPWKQPRTRLKGNPYVSPRSGRTYRISPPTTNRKRTSDREVSRSPSNSPGKVCTRAATTAVVGGSGRSKSAAQSDSSDGELAEGLGYTAVPGDYFCSWECAGSWNARFSPVQARHERRVRIDIAAGRVVTR